MKKVHEGPRGGGGYNEVCVKKNGTVECDGGRLEWPVEGGDSSVTEIFRGD